MGTAEGAWRVVALLAGAAVVWLGASRGMWEGPLVVAALWGFGASTTRRALGGAVVMAVVGYGAALAALALQGPVGAAASEVAAIMGFGRLGVIVWALTAVLALSQALVGAWVGRAAAGLVHGTDLGVGR